jgi:hypothetical protein
VTEKKPYEAPAIVREEPRKIFASTMLYAASKRLGLEKASGELMRQLGGLAQAGAANIVAVDDVQWWGFPAALTLARVAICGPLKLHVNAGSTVIGKARSIAANEFLEDPECAVWFSVDDDVVVSADAVAAMIEQCLREPCVVVAPCLQRGTDVVNIVASSPLVDARGFQAIEMGGFGAVCFSRAVIDGATDANVAKELGIILPDVWDHEGKEYRAIFRDLVLHRQWYTEDKAFFVSNPDVPAYAVRSGFTTHAGQRLDLATLKPVVQVERTPLVV